MRIQLDSCIREINYNESLARQLKQRHFSMDTEKIFTNLKHSMNGFHLIFRMTSLVNKMFGLSLLVNLLSAFVQLLSNLFLIYRKLYLEDLVGLHGNNKTQFCLNQHLNFENYFFSGSLIRTAPTIFINVMILVSCENCITEV